MFVFPTCIHLHVCVSSDVISRQWSGRRDGEYVSFLNKETGGRTQ